MTSTKPTTLYSITAAHRITGKSRTTIQKHLKKGKLSCTEDDNGVKQIDASELIRVYGDDCDFSREAPASNQPRELDEAATASVRTELDTLRERLDMVTQERQRERERLESEVEHLREALQRAQESGSRALLLLEDRSGRGELRQAIARLERRLDDRDEDKSAPLTPNGRATWLDLPWWSLLLGRRLSRSN